MDLASQHTHTSRGTSLLSWYSWPNHRRIFCSSHYFLRQNPIQSNNFPNDLSRLRQFTLKNHSMSLLLTAAPSNLAYKFPIIRQQCSKIGCAFTINVRPSIKMVVSSGYLGGDANYKDKMYRRLDSCLVVPPPEGKKPRAIIKFLGGAFIGAVPEVTYSHLIDLLAREGYLIISVPYNVTFDHSQAAREVYEKFNACLNVVSTSGLPYADLSAEELARLPVYSVGHSNGALLQLLTGSYFSEKIPKANAIISFNNRPATEAVPYFEQLGPLVRQMAPVMETLPMYTMARNTSGNAWNAFLDTAKTVFQQYDQEAVVSLTKFADQLPSVMNQVTEGTSEFKPTPSENRECFRNLYNVPHTLLVKFNFDAIDETDVVEEILKPRVELIGGTLEKVTLNGNHLTPCLQDPRWQVGTIYTPADALAQGFKALALNDTRVLAKTIANWLRRVQLKRQN